MVLLPLLIALLAPPPDGGDAWTDIRGAVNNTALQSLKLYVDGEDRIVRVVVTHLDHSVAPPSHRQRMDALMPGGTITHYKRARTVGEGPWHKVDVGGADDFEGLGCELHAPEQGGPDAFSECVIAHADVPHALMKRATALVPGAKPVRSKKIIRDVGTTTYEIDVKGDGAARATLYIRANGEESMRRVFVPASALPPKVAAQVAQLLPQGAITEAQHKRAAGRPDELMVTVRRGASVHTLRFSSEGALRRHQVEMPALINVDVFRAEGEPEPVKPY